MSKPTLDRLPFEPKRRKAKPAKAAAPAPVATQASEPKQSSKVSRSQPKLEETRIPDAVSQRMLRRILAFSGVPTGLGVAVFFLSYWLVSREIIPLPTSAVVLASMGCFGLGVLGLTYGLLSASWDEQQDGSLLGWDEFRLNGGRMITAWRESRAARQQAKSDS
ncbi:PAM68 family protein [Synechococcus elongatus]|uniref:PAM68 family protein n=1 Tax=Synechococcus elongatus TaxID=32046 RepID=UPI000F7F69FE|nr:PAM68 family protein [Synechococcus elongatus]